MIEKNRCSRKLLTVIGLLMSSMMMSSYGENHLTQQTVAEDIVLYESFMATNEAINLHVKGDFVTIGADKACDFDASLFTLQNVIDSGINEIRVATNGVYQENIVIDNQSIIIRGGFATCVEASNNIQVFTAFSDIDGNQVASPIVTITGNEQHLIRLENLNITGSNNTGQSGGGILLDQTENTELQLLRVAITGNKAKDGAGIAVESGDVDVFGQDVYISNNVAESLGGGLKCGSALNQVTMTGMSIITNNEADYGGGVFLASCNMNMYSRFHEEALIIAAGIYGNSVSVNGGGIYIQTVTTMNMFGQKMCVEQGCLGSNNAPIQLSSNQTTLNSDSHGGGLFIEHRLNPPLPNRTIFYANGLLMDNNSSAGNGGGAYVDEHTNVVIERLEGGCWNKERCNLILNNRSGTSLGFGGAFYVDGGTLEMGQTFVEENRADFGTAIYASGELAQVTIEGSVFDDNGDEGADGYSDFYVVGASLGASVDVKYSNFVQNDAVNSVFDIDPALSSSMRLMSSIIYDASSGNVFGGASGSLSIDCVLAHEDVSFTGNNVVVGNPSFFNGPGGDFHLAPNSPAIDMCQNIPVNHPRDMDNEPRGWDDPDNNNGSGLFDAGADESYVTDVIFENGFEAILAR